MIRYSLFAAVVLASLAATGCRPSAPPKGPNTTEVEPQMPEQDSQTACLGSPADARNS